MSTPNYLKDEKESLKLRREVYQTQLQEKKEWKKRILSCSLEEAIVNGEQQMALDILQEQYIQYFVTKGDELFEIAKQTKDYGYLMHWLTQYGGNTDDDFMVKLIEHSIHMNFIPLFEGLVGLCNIRQKSEQLDKILDVILENKNQEIFEVFLNNFSSCYSKEEREKIELRASLICMEDDDEE